MLLEQMEQRVMLSAAIVTTTSGPTGVAQPSAWMGQLADSIPLTDMSIPGTVNSAAGPSLQDALLGSGAENMVNPPSPTNNGVNDAQLAAYATATTASEAAIAAGGENDALNNTATSANAAATAADITAGITQVSTGAGLALGLTSDITGLASAIASAVQQKLSSTDAAP
jgi:hypothetical protein